jgi:hypothetical protein
MTLPLDQYKGDLISKYNLKKERFSIKEGGCRGRDCMVVGFTTTLCIKNSLDIG